MHLLPAAKKVTARKMPLLVRRIGVQFPVLTSSLYLKLASTNLPSMSRGAIRTIADIPASLLAQLMLEFGNFSLRLRLGGYAKN